MLEAVDYSVLFGRFYPEYDIAVSLLWTFVIFSGFGNWLVIWCILKTKSLRNPFNIIVLALAFANGVATTVIGPMNLIRILMANNQVTIHWCNARVLLKTFCFSVSMMIIFTLSAMRMTAGLLKTQKKPTYKKMVGIVVFIYCLATLTAPVFLDKTTDTYRTCLGNVNENTLKIILQNEGLLPAEVANTSASVDNQTHAYNQSSTYYDQMWITSTIPGLEANSTISNMSDTTFLNDTNAQVKSRTTDPWVFYLVMCIALFIGTLICYIALVLILKRHKNAMKSMTLGNSKDILTMRVTAYVTCTFFISFLVPFFPALIRLRPQYTAANMHYISIFHCLSYIDGALTPIIYYFSNPCYKNALRKALPHWTQKCFCNNPQIAPAPSAPSGQPSPSPGVVSVESVSAAVPHVA